jgi:outer membrane receptor protein involved in Fe transport
VYVMDHRPTELESPYSTDYFTTVRLHDPVFLNAKVSQRFLKDYEVYFLAKNLIDDYNADPFDPGPGRTFYLGISAKWH